MRWVDPRNARRILGRWRIRWQARGLSGAPLPAAPVRVAGVEFPNAVGLAAGIAPRCRGLTALSRLGFGHIETGTLPVGPGLAAARNRCLHHLAAVSRLPDAERPRVGISLRPTHDIETPPDENEWSETLRAFWPLIDYWVLNLSLPGSSLRKSGDCSLALTRNLHGIRRVAVSVARALGPQRPMFIKIAHPEDTGEGTRHLLRAACSLGVDGAIVAFERWRQPPGAIHQAIREVSHALWPMPIVAVGGVRSVGDVLAYLGAGAALVQCYSLPTQQSPQAVRGMIGAVAAATGSAVCADSYA